MNLPAYLFTTASGGLYKALYTYQGFWGVIDEEDGQIVNTFESWDQIKEFFNYYFSDPIDEVERLL